MVGVADEVWWSRRAQPEPQHGVAAGARTRLQNLERGTADKQALACSGVLVRQAGQQARMRRRFVEGRPGSSVTIDVLAWGSQRVAQQGGSGWLLIGETAAWPTREHVRSWRREHQRKVKAGGTGVRIVACLLPSTRAWLTPIEPKWGPGKRAVSEGARLLRAEELEGRVGA